MQADDPLLLKCISKTGLSFFPNSYKYIYWIDDDAQQHTCVKWKPQVSTEMKQLDNYSVNNDSIKYHTSMCCIA